MIRKQDASVIPFPIVLSGSVVSFLWFLYGVILLNDFMIVSIQKKLHDICDISPYN